MTVRLLLITLFFASGISALVYEVVWIRALSLTFSITVYSLTTVLCAFMAGLGLGAAISARFADRLRRPLIAFGVAELGIAASGMVVPDILSSLGPAYLSLFESFGGAGVAFSVSRFGLAFLVLVIPSTLMGVTLPLLSRAVIDRDAVVGSRAGELYGANTIGAVFGCILAGFVWIPAFGLTTTSAIAAGLNIAIACGAFAIAVRHRVSVPEPSAKAKRGRLSTAVRLAALTYAVSGFTAMGYEVLWTRALEHYTHNSTYAYTAMLATFLAGLGVGSAVCSRVADRFRDPLFAVGVIQIAIGFAVLVALRIYMGFDTFVPAAAAQIGGLTSWRQVVVLMFTETGLTMLVMSLLLGAMFPLVARVAVDSLDSVGERIGFVYVANTVGSILGSVFVGFGLLPWLGMRGAFLTLVIANLSLGVFVVSRQQRTGAGRWIALAGGVAILASFWILPTELFKNQFVQRYGDLLFYKEEVTDTVMVTENEQGERLIRYADGRGTAGTGTVVGDRMYGHLPLMLHPEPRKVLQICFGVGNSLSAVLQHPVELVDAVELSPGVLEAAPFFSSTNRDSMDDPRVNMIINDGRNFLLTSNELYDVIRLDPPELHTRGVVNLYTKEFYELARERLAPGGIFSIWINNVMTPEEEIKMLLRTMAQVFPYVSVWHDPMMFSWIINGSMAPHDPDLEVLETAFARPEVAADMTSIGIRDPYEFLNHYVFSDQELIDWAGGGPLVVDDHTRLDFSVPRSRDAFYGLGNFNTDYYLLEFLDEGQSAPENVALRIFGEKVRRLAAVKESVLPSISNLSEYRLESQEVERRLEEARGSLLIKSRRDSPEGPPQTRVPVDAR
jgi:spermidine synthase